MPTVLRSDVCYTRHDIMRRCKTKNMGQCPGLGTGISIEMRVQLLAESHEIKSIIVILLFVFNFSNIQHTIL